MTNNLTKTQGIVLAAGKSSRFKAEESKLLHTLCGQEIILYPLKAFQELCIPTTFVVGHQKEHIIATISANAKDQSVIFIEQSETKGTGHALAITKKYWTADNILVMNGDSPLVSSAILKRLLDHHLETNADISLIKAHNQDPLVRGYGRIIQKGQAICIREEKSLGENATPMCCVNAGIYLFKKKFLDAMIDQLVPDSITGEIYITDLINMANDNRYRVELVEAPFNSIRGINTIKELWEAEFLKRTELISKLMDNGVIFTAAPNTHLEINVNIGYGTIIGPGVMLKKNTTIGRNCHIEAYTSISDSVIGDNVQIFPFCVINGSHIASHAAIGPFAHIRTNTDIGAFSHIGSFVETSKTTMGEHSKAKHLSYLGNAIIGSHVNIGAGTITCNYNGVGKFATTINDYAHIGALNALIAPLEIGEHAMTAAGSTITENVPAHGFAIARERQTTKEYYAPKLKEKFEVLEENKKTKPNVHPKTASKSAEL